MVPEDIDGHLDEVLIDEETLAKRVQQLADDIVADYDDRPVLFVAVLKGAVMFLADLSRAIDRALAVADVDDAVLITGSLYVVGSARPYLRKVL